MKLFRLILFASLLLVISAECFGLPCGAVLAVPGQPMLDIDPIESSLKQLYDNGTLTITDLMSIRRGENPLASRRDIKSMTYSSVVTAMLANHPLQWQQKIDSVIESVRGEVRQQNIQKVETMSAHWQTHFYDIEPGSFLMGSEWQLGAYNPPDEPIHAVHLTKGFRIADAPITQFQYAFVMHENPSWFKAGADSVTIKFDDNLVEMRPDNPVDSVTPQEENEFLRRVNEWSKTNDSRIYVLFPNHEPYAQIRVPTEGEFEFVIRNRGKWTGKFPNEIGDVGMREYAWYWINVRPKLSTQPVGEKLPLMVDGNKPIYDLIGNISERVADTYNRTYGLSSEQLGKVTVDPIFVQPNGELVYRGGNYDSETIDLRLGGRISSFGSKSVAGGFRVVEVPR